MLTSSFEICAGCYVVLAKNIPNLVYFSNELVYAQPVSREAPGVVEDHIGDTYRAVYTVRFEGAVYVLHAFQKKSKTGIKTPKEDINLIKGRLKRAALDYESRGKS